MRKKTDLHGYQMRGYSHIMTHKKSALWLDMGLGKTVTTLTAIDELMFNEFSIYKTLIIAPLRVANTVWHKEALQWEHLHRLRFSIVTGNEKERLCALQRSADIYVINRENIQWLVDTLGKRWNFDMVVIDESSSFKSHTSKRFKALKRVLPFTDRVVQLTGTPSPNGYMDIWSQLYLLDSGARLGRNISAYRDRFFDKDFMGYNYDLRTGSAFVIQELIKDLVISMSSEDYLTLPEFIPTVIHNKLDGKLLKDYSTFEKQMLMSIGNTTVTAMSAGVLTNKLLQFCSGNIYDDDGNTIHIHDLKIEMLQEIIDENPNDNILVAYNYKSELEALKKAFPHGVLLGKGGEAVDAWNAGKIPLMFAHPASAGHGLNLQKGGKVLVWYGFTWSLELYQQFNKRLHRQGQTDNVRAFHLAVGDTEYRLMETLVSKEVTQKSLLDALKPN